PHTRRTGRRPPPAPAATAGSTCHGLTNPAWDRDHSGSEISLLHPGFRQKQVPRRAQPRPRTPRFPGAFSWIRGVRPRLCTEPSLANPANVATSASLVTDGSWTAAPPHQVSMQSDRGRRVSHAGGTPP